MVVGGDGGDGGGWGFASWERSTKYCTCGKICTSRFTKSCACHEICTSRLTKCFACHEICSSGFTTCFACHEVCTSRFTKCCAFHEICTFRWTKCCVGHQSAFQDSHGAALTRRFAARASKDNIKIPKRSFRAISESEPHVGFHDSKVLHLPRNLHFEVKPLRSFSPVTKSLLWTTKDTRFPLRLPREVTTMSENVRKCARHHYESAVATSTRSSQPDFASLRSRSALRRFREA